jgi:hypothetical protein
MYNDESNRATFELDAYLNDASLTEGQRRRLGLFRSVESGVSSRIELLCERSGIEVTDVAVLVIGPALLTACLGMEASGLTNVVLGHRTWIYALLHAVLPPLSGAPADPYADLLKPSPDRSVRVLILDEEAMTVISYGTFITVCIHPTHRAVA